MIAANNLALYTILIATPLLLARRGWHPGRAALVLSVLSIGSVVGALAGGRLVDLLGRRTPAVLGGGLLALLLVPLFGGLGTAGLASLGLMLLLAGVSLGLATPALQAATLEGAAPDDTGLAAGLAGTARYVGSIAGTVLVSRTLEMGDGAALATMPILTVVLGATVSGTVLALSLPARKRQPGRLLQASPRGGAT